MSLTALRRNVKHRLSFVDVTALKLLDVTGRRQLVQAIWVYDRPIDSAGIQRFRDNFARGIGNRVIRRPVLPMARPRWAKPRVTPRAHVSTTPMPRGDLLAWADSCAEKALDLYAGPSWNLHVQPFDDGSTGICMTGSHIIGDAYGAFMAMGQAIVGDVPSPPYGEADAPPRLLDLIGDVAVVVHDLPQTLRALRSARSARASRRRDTPASTRRVSEVSGDAVTPIPSIAIRIDSATWRARATDMGGTSASLLADFAYRLAKGLGRTNSHGDVTLVIPISIREGVEDDRAFALAFGKVTLGASEEEHGRLRTALREAITAAREDPDSMFGLLPLVSWVPQGFIRRVMDGMFAYEDERPVSLSNLGVVPSQIAALDGTPADWFLTRSRDLGVRWSELVRTRGHLVVVGLIVDETLTVCIESHQGAQAENSQGLRDAAALVLEQLEVPGRIEWS